MIEAIPYGVNFWGHYLYVTKKGTVLVKLSEGFHTLCDNEDVDSDPNRCIKDGIVKIVPKFSK